MATTSLRRDLTVTARHCGRRLSNGTTRSRSSQRKVRCSENHWDCAAASITAFDSSQSPPSAGASEEVQQRSRPSKMPSRIRGGARRPKSTETSISSPVRLAGTRLYFLQQARFPAPAECRSAWSSEKGADLSTRRRSTRSGKLYSTAVVMDDDRSIDRSTPGPEAVIITHGRLAWCETRRHGCMAAWVSEEENAGCLIWLLARSRYSRAQRCGERDRGKTEEWTRKHGRLRSTASPMPLRC